MSKNNFHNTFNSLFYQLMKVVTSRTYYLEIDTAQDASFSLANDISSDDDKLATIFAAANASASKGVASGLEAERLYIRTVIIVATESNQRKPITCFLPFVNMIHFISEYICRGDDVPKVRSMKDFPESLIPFLVRAPIEEIAPRFTSLEYGKPTMFSLGCHSHVDPAHHLIMSRLSSAFYDLGRLVNHPERWPILTQDLMVCIIFFLISDQLLFTVDEVDEIKTLCNDTGLNFRNEVYLHKTNQFISMLDKGKPEPTNRPLIIKAIATYVKIFTKRQDSRPNPFVIEHLSDTNHVFIDMGRMTIVKPTLVDSDGKKTSLDHTFKYLQSVCAGNHTDLNCINGDVKDDADSNNNNNKRQKMSTETSDVACMVSISNPPEITEFIEMKSTQMLNLMSVIDIHTESDVPNVIGSGHGLLCKLDQIKLETHWVYRACVAADLITKYHGVEHGHSCYLYGFLSRAFISEKTWGDVIAYLTHVYTWDIDVSNTLLQESNRKSDEDAQVVVSVTINTVNELVAAYSQMMKGFGHDKIFLLMRMIMALSSCFHVRMKKDALGPAVDVINYMKKHLKEKIPSLADSVADILASMEKNKGCNNVYYIWAMISAFVSKPAWHAINVWTLLDAMELSIGEFGVMGSIAVKMHNEQDTFMDQVRESLDASSVPLATKFDDNNQKRFRRLRLIKVDEEALKEISMGAKSLAKVLALIEFHHKGVRNENNNNATTVANALSADWGREVDAMKFPHGLIIESVASRTEHMYPIFRSYFNVEKRQSLGPTPERKDYYTDIIYHNECDPRFVYMCPINAMSHVYARYFSKLNIPRGISEKFFAKYTSILNESS